jgi:hypothetical protein
MILEYKGESRSMMFPFIVVLGELAVIFFVVTSVPLYQGLSTSALLAFCIK